MTRPQRVAERGGVQGRVVLLGPQRFRPTVRDALLALGVEGPVAAITAGWQEREGENQELGDHLGCEVVDLMLYHRADEVYARDRGLAAALRERQESLHELQLLYKLRLEHALSAARDLLSHRPGTWVEAARRAAVHGLRVLDRQHAGALRRFHADFERRVHPARRPEVARQRAEIGRDLARARALCIAGGHVAVLLNRLRLFDLPPLIGERPIVAWSAGAMAVSDRVFLFHDNPPQGPGNAELLDAGLGLCPGLVAFPHARRRLRLDDRARSGLLASRLSPALCALLDDGARFDWDGRSWSAGPASYVLDAEGRVVEAPAA